VILYVTHQGAGLHLRGENLLVRQAREVLARVHLFELEQVVLLGNVSLSTPVMAAFLKRGVDAVLLSSTGQYRGRLVGPNRGNVVLRQAQFRRYGEEDFRLRLGRTLVEGKLRNMRALLMRLARRRGQDASQVAHRLRGLVQQVESAESAASLRGIEGAGTAAYFGALRAFLPQELGFTTRNRRPPRDPANALLSFGYALLANSVESAVYQVGLDPYLGFLHLVDYGRPSLALDLMEEFRPVLVDMMVLDMANHGMVKGEHFEKRDGGVFLNAPGRERVIAHFQRRLEERVSYVVGQGRVEHLAYRRCLEYQARRLARVIMGEEEGYASFLVR
jgi:CRISPR-associated protein Cas1